MPFDQPVNFKSDYLQYEQEYIHIKRHLDSDTVDKGLEYITALQNKLDDSISIHDQLILDVLTCILLTKTNKFSDNIQLISKLDGTINDQFMLFDFTIAKADTFWKIGKPLDGLTALENIEQDISIFKNEFLSSDNLQTRSIIEREVEVQNLKGIIYAYLGNIHKAHTSFQLAFSQVHKLSNKAYLATSFSHLGAIYSSLGELQLSLDHHTRALELRKNLPNKTDLAYSYGNVAEIFRYMSNYNSSLYFYKQAQFIFESLDNKLFCAQVYHDLINVSLACDNLSEAQMYLDKLKLLESQSNENQSEQYIHLYLQISEALIFKNGSNFKSKVLAQQKLNDIINKPIINFDIYILALINFIELLIDEFLLFEQQQVFDDLKKYIERIHQVAMDQNSFALLTNDYLLQARLALADNDITQAELLLNKASELAKEHALTSLYYKAKEERNKLLEKLLKWQELINKNNPIKERTLITELRDYWTEATRIMKLKNTF